MWTRRRELRGGGAAALVALAGAMAWGMALQAGAAQPVKSPHAGAAVPAKKPVAVGSLISQLQYSVTDTQRLKAVAALEDADLKGMGHDETKRLVAALTQVMRSARTAEPAEAVAAMLAKIGGAIVFDALLAEIKSSPGDQGKLAAVRAIGLLGPEMKDRGVSLLTDIQSNPRSSPALKNEAVKSLLKLEVPLSDAMLPSVVTAMNESKDGDEKVRLALLIYEAKVSNAPYLPDVERAIGDSLKANDISDFQMTKDALLTLLKIDSPSSVKAVRAYVPGLDGGKRGDLFAAIGDNRILTEAALGLLIERVEGKPEPATPASVAFAIQSLGKLAPRASRDEQGRILEILKKFEKRIPTSGHDWIADQLKQAIKSIDAAMNKKP